MAEFRVSRQIDIAARPRDIASVLSDFRRWPEFSAFETTDSDIDREFRGAPRGVGAVYEYNSNEERSAGIMEITEARDDLVAVQLRFLKPFKSQMDHRFELTAKAPDLTEVRWVMHGEHKGLLGVLAKYLLPMEKLMGPQIERGLQRLKDLLEG